ncbi:MAG: hypothetical protein COS88_01835, partial [Chloroflexi bacterium CG07_land_8_20_14_0_80_51_10]
MDGFYKDPSSKGIIVRIGIESGNSPDLLSIHTPATLLGYIEKNALLDLTRYMRHYNIDPKDFWPALRPYMEHKGKIYGLPTNCNPLVLFYNKKMFDEAGIAYPTEKWTWKDLLKVSVKLTKKNQKTGRFVQFGLFCEDPDLFIWQNGGWRYSKDGKKCVIDSPEAKEAFRWYYDLRFKHHVMPTPSEVQNLDITKKVAMFIQGRRTAMTLRKDKTLDWNIAPVPRGKYKVTKLTSKVYA